MVICHYLYYPYYLYYAKIVDILYLMGRNEKSALGELFSIILLNNRLLKNYLHVL